MPYWKKTSSSSRILDNYGLSTIQSSNTGTSAEFYELELGIVLDIILDESHPYFNKNQLSVLDADRWPEDLENKKPLPTDKNYSFIGRALIRPVESGNGLPKDKLIWALPLESNISEYPLINECVVISKYDNTIYYSRKLNYRNYVNNNLDFSAISKYSFEPNKELYSDNPYTGKMESTTCYNPTADYKGYAGKYFVSNNKIRSVKRYEGDLVIESRHGQSIHMTAYDGNRQNDVGKYPDYKNCGNPMILIRNRQRQLVKSGKTITPHKKLPDIVGTLTEKNVGGYLQEDINHDGSSIHITSGLTESTWKTTCYKKMFGTDEEVPAFKGKSTFKYPKLDGDQIVVQSDRLIFSSRYAETFHYSKKRYSIVTDSEYTVDAHDQIVFTTHNKTVINSPAIYLGEYDQTNEPALLGQTTVTWLYELCDWLLTHTHKYEHSHVDAGKESPSFTQLPKEIQQLISLRDTLHTLLSRRVFLVGGGWAEGQDGAKIEEESVEPLNLNVEDPPNPVTELTRYSDKSVISKIPWGSTKEAISKSTGGLRGIVGSASPAMGSASSGASGVATSVANNAGSVSSSIGGVTKKVPTKIPGGWNVSNYRPKPLKAFKSPIDNAKNTVNSKVETASNLSKSSVGSVESGASTLANNTANSSVGGITTATSGNIASSTINKIST